MEYAVARPVGERTRAVGYVLKKPADPGFAVGWLVFNPWEGADHCRSSRLHGCDYSLHECEVRPWLLEPMAFPPELRHLAAGEPKPLGLRLRVQRPMIHSLDD